MPNEPQVPPVPEYGTPEWNMMMENLTRRRNERDAARTGPFNDYGWETEAAPQPTPPTQLDPTMGPTDQQWGAAFLRTPDGGPPIQPRIDPGDQIPATPPTVRVRNRGAQRTVRVERADAGFDGLVNPTTPVPVPVITGTRLIGIRAMDQTLEVMAHFTGGRQPFALTVPYYPDVGRGHMPYSKALTQHLAEVIQAVQNLPEPPRRQLPNLTVGERLYNMLGLMMERDDTNPLQGEWQALRYEYEQIMAERRY